MSSILRPNQLIAFFLKALFKVLFIIQAIVLVVWIFLWNLFKKVVCKKKSNPFFWKQTHKDIFHCRYKSIKSRGYTVQQHWFETEDKAYVLCWRVFPKNKEQNVENENTKYPIIIQHGLLDCSVSWFIHQQQEKCLPFILAQQGYDVWIGNNRGNRYSKKSEHQNQYWNYKFDHLAQYDLPAIINNVLKQTKAEKVIYIGHSQGGTQMMAALGYYPQLIDKIHSFFALGTPISIKGSSQHRVIRMSSLFSFCKITRLLGFKTLFLIPQWMNRIIGFLIYHTSLYKWIFYKMLTQLCGASKHNNIDMNIFGVILSYEPGGSSIGNIQQWIQSYKNGKNLSKFDYGTSKNLQLYGSEQPPELDFEHLKTVPFHSYLFFGTSDLVLNEIDKRQMINKFDQKLVSVIDLEDYAHLDYIWGINAHKDIYHPIIKILNHTDIEKKDLQQLDSLRTQNSLESI